MQEKDYSVCRIQNTGTFSFLPVYRSFSRVMVKRPPRNFIKLQGGLLTITLEKYLWKIAHNNNFMGQF